MAAYEVKMSLLSGLTVTSVEEEKVHNPRLTKNKDEFVEIMENLNLDYPKKIGKHKQSFEGGTLLREMSLPWLTHFSLDAAVPANLVDGTEQVDENLVRQIRHG